MSERGLLAQIAADFGISEWTLALSGVVVPAASSVTSTRIDGRRGAGILIALDVTVHGVGNLAFAIEQLFPGSASWVNISHLTAPGYAVRTTTGKQFFQPISVGSYGASLRLPADIFRVRVDSTCAGPSTVTVYTALIQKL